jgi:hypothetical protein
MAIKKQIMTIVALLCIAFSLNIFAQVTITVGKTGTVDCATITAAIQRSHPGDIIKIMDAEIYAEQVTIDSTHYPLTLTSSNPTALTKPTIKFQDKDNVHPKTYEESQSDNTINFDKNGALRLVGARNVIIDGVAVDGGGSFVYFYDAIWNQSNPLLYGNCAISLWHCGNIIIRNCDVSNAYFGIQLKDRNLGGVFANPNPADIDTVNNVPLSQFGQQGNHLIERNRIHNNSFGIYSESQWDLGSTVRYNLIYQNHHTSTVETALKAMSSEWGNQPGGAFFFKDVPLSPLAIYNNTFYKNLMIFAGHWQSGYIHLIFNNIFGPPSTYWTSVTGFSTSQDLTPAMTSRIYNCVYSAQVRPPQANYTQIMDRLQQIQGNGGAAPDPGTLLSPPAGTNPGFTAAANVRWLEMDSSMFLSTSPASDKFLEPNWDDQYVKDYIIQKGWVASGVKNTDGTTADLGAIEQAHGKPSFVGIIQATYPITVGSTAGEALIRFSLNQRENTTMSSPVIKLFRLVKIKYLKDSFGSGDIATIGISAADMTTLPVPAAPVKVGDNSYTISVNLTGQTYAFIEMIIEATGADGNKFTTSTGFLPYRQLDYKFIVEVLNKADKVIDTVRVGDTVQLKLTPQKMNGTAFTNLIKPVAVTLLQEAPTDQLLTPGTPDLVPLAYPNGVTGVDIKKVIFTKVPIENSSKENISASGTWKNTSGQFLPFLGITTVVVLSGPPEKVVFRNPPSDSLKLAHPVLPAGFAYPCTLFVFDKYGNKVNSPAQVVVKSIMPDLANVVGGHPDTTITTDVNGVGVFKVMTTVNAPKDAIVTFSGNVVGKTYTDYASMIIGERAEHLVIFYSDTVLDLSVELRGQVGEKLPITVIATKSKTTPSINDVFDIAATFTIIGSNPASMKFYSSPTAPTPTNTFTLVNGKITLWVTSKDSLNNAGVSMTSENIIASDTRDKIYFTRPLVSIDSAFYFSNNGLGKVDSVEIYLKDTISLVSDSIWLFWPNKVESGKKAILGTNPAMRFGANKKQITISLAADPFPADITGGSSTDKLGVTFNKPNTLVTQEDSSKFIITDRVGPLLMKATVVERIAAGPGIDTFFVTFSEEVLKTTLTGAGLILIQNGAPSNLTILNADTVNGQFRLVVQSTTVKPQYGDSLKINPSGPITDLVGNHAHLLNRPIPLYVKTVPANIVAAAYFDKEGQIADGVVDLVTIKFDKNVIIADLDLTLEWTGAGGSNKADHIDKSLISFVTGDNSQINVAVRGKFSGLQENAVRTEGAMIATVKYISLSESRSGTVLDSTAPVLVDSAIYKPGRRPANTINDNDHDTLYVTFSEPITQISYQTPFITWGKSGDYKMNLEIPPQMNPEPGTKTTYKFIVMPYTDQNFFPKNGDSLRIDPMASIGDVNKAVQSNTNNRRVPLIVMPIPYIINVLVVNSPVNLSSIEMNKNIMEVIVKPDIKMVEQVNLKVTGYIFDGLGNSMHVIEQAFDPTAGPENGLRIKWDCKNKNQRLVGTGVYLMSLVLWKDGAKYGPTIYKKIGVKR